MRLRPRLATIATVIAAGVALGAAAPAQALNCAQFKPAVENANNGDTITLDAGLTCNDSYTIPGDRNPPFAITIQGGGTGATLDGTALGAPILQGSAQTGKQIVVTIRNLTFRNGSAPNAAAISLGASDVGATLVNDRFLGNHSPADSGAVDIESDNPARTITVTRSTFGNGTGAGANTSGNGTGALRILGFATGPAITVTRNTFNANRGAGSGGAATLSAGADNRPLTISDNVFMNNTAAGSGGGLVVQGTHATVRRNRFTHNHVLVPQGFLTVARGGGMMATGNGTTGSKLTQSGNVFDGNTAGGAVTPNMDVIGGGEVVFASELTSRGDRFVRNTLSSSHGNGEAEGAGLAVEGCKVSMQPVTVFHDRLEQVVAAGNTGAGDTDGAGVYAGGCLSGPVALTVLDSTIAGNSSKGGTSGLNGGPDDTLVLRNSIVAGNRGAVDLLGFGKGRTVTHSDACGPGKLTGAGNICANPLLADPFHANVHETFASPTIDRGANAEIAPGLATDIDGNARTLGKRVDMGADEYLDPFRGVLIPKQSAKVRRGRARVKVRCPNNVRGPCVGSLTLRKAKHRKGKKGQKVATGKFSVKRGKTAKVRVKLLGAGTGALAKHSSLRTVAFASARDGLGLKRTSSGRVKLRR